MRHVFSIRTLVILQSLLLLILLFQSDWYKMCREPSLNPENRKILVQLALKALETKEVPVASVVLYNGKIIGKGYNTVNRDTNIGGHAEINALSDAIKKIGSKPFNELNRDSLVLITTYEPCMMCKGALMENRIYNVEFIKGKGSAHWIKNHFKSLRYEWGKRKSDEEKLQDSLFYLHPSFIKSKKETGRE